MRGGGTAYALQADGGDEPEHATATRKTAAVDGLREAIAELAQTAVGWDDEEFQYQLRKRCGIEASLADVQRARLELNGTRA